MGFNRLSMSIECEAILTCPAGGVPPVASSSLSPGSDNIISYRKQCVQVSHKELEITSPRTTIWTCLAHHELNKQITLPLMHHVKCTYT